VSYTILRGRWFDVIVLNVHVPCEDKSDGVKDSFYGELKCVFDQVSRYDIKTFWVISMREYAEKIFSNRQLRMSVRTEILMIMQLKLATSNNLNIFIPCSVIKLMRILPTTFIH
jgi:hypothetical protein